MRTWYLSRVRAKGLAALLLASAVPLAFGPAGEGAPAPAPRTGPAGNRVDDLSLRLEVPRALGEKGGALKLVLVNHEGRARSVPNFPSYGFARRWEAPGVTYVVRFKNGDVHEAIPDFNVTPKAAAKLKRRPLAVPADGLQRTRSVYEALEDHQLRLSLLRCKEFCVTAIVEGLGLKSNTAFVNGTFPLDKGWSPFKDAKEARRRQAERMKNN